MAEPIIKVQGLGKKYVISHEKQERYTALRDVISRGARRIMKGNEAPVPRKEDFWALKNVSFQVQRGEAIGIMGRNGAGKSTLLKVLSRITEPTTGRIEINGRVASLLEVGTGFHHELTGRENIFLNGAILGMSRLEIRKKFDEIVDFAGVEKFLDTPVKRYSSGMYVRLAFAVAAHLEPEVLVVDEVLAVGDAEFQKKCLGKMNDVSQKDGRTVLFVSHNMAAIKSLCSHAMVLENGSIKIMDETTSAINYYLQGGTENRHQKIFGTEYDKSAFQLHEISVKAQGRNIEDSLDEYQEIELNTVVTIKNGKAENYHLTYVINGEDGTSLFTFTHLHTGLRLKNGRNSLKCIFPKGFLNIGSFYFTLYIIEDKRNTIFVEKDIFSIRIHEGEREIGAWMGKEPGYIKPEFKWEMAQ